MAAQPSPAPPAPPPSRAKRKPVPPTVSHPPKPPARNLLHRSVALHTDVPRWQYAQWSSARRRAWDRRHSHPNAYFYHYCHPSFTPKRAPWRIQDHRLFLAAISTIAPLERNWSAISLLVPGRTGSDCRRYYHRIGRAGFITVRGTIRKRLVCTASIVSYDEHGKSTGRMRSANPLFRTNALSKFVPSTLPPVDDSLLKPFQKQPEPLSKQLLDALTHIPDRYEEYDRQLVQPCKPPTNTKPLVCRLRIRAARLTVSHHASEHTQSAHNSAHTTDPQHDLLDMHVSDHTSSTSTPPEHDRASKKRVLALSKADRASLAFLLNSDEEQPPLKHPRSHQLHNKSTAVLSLHQSSLPTQQGPAFKSCNAPREYQPAAVRPHDIPVDNATHSATTEGQPALSAKLQQLQLLLKMFVDDVDDVGVSLGHAVERRRLLQRYEQFSTWVCSGMSESALLKSARLLAHSPGCRYSSMLGLQPVGEELQWRSIVDCWMSQIDEMTQRQNHELVVAAQLARVV